ncbi:hypothetical protein D3C85_1633090 [compost metagenome]
MFSGKWQLGHGCPLALLIGHGMVMTRVHFFGSSMFKGKWQFRNGCPLALLIGHGLVMTRAHFFGSSMFKGKWQLNWCPFTLLISGVCTHCFWA